MEDKFDSPGHIFREKEGDDEKNIPSSSIMLIRNVKDVESNDGYDYEFLFTKRKQKMSFGNMHVFPGGKIDKTDELKHWECVFPEFANKNMTVEHFDIRMAAVREIYEEINVILQNNSKARLSEAFEDKNKHLDFAVFCKKYEIYPDI